MDAKFDDLHDPKHERVAKALEQVNQLRYRYHPVSRDGKTLLRFDSDDDEEDQSDGSDNGDEESSSKAQRQRPSVKQVKRGNDEVDSPEVTLDDHVENLLQKTRTLAMLKIANNTAGTIPSDSESDSEDDNDVVSEELGHSINGKRVASSEKLSRLGSSPNMREQSSLLYTTSMKLARTLSAFLCLPRAISYVDLEAITQRLLESPNEQVNDDEYGDLIDCHVDSARDDDTQTQESDPLWKRRHSRPVRPLNLSEDPTSLEIHQRQMFMEANRFGGVSSRNLFLASSKHLLSKDDSKGSMYLGLSLSGRLLGSSTNASSANLSCRGQECGSTTAHSDPNDDIAKDASNPFDEKEYIKWRTQVKEDYLAWLNAKIAAQKHRKSRAKKRDPNEKPRWLLLYEASKRPTQKYRAGANE